MNPRTSAIVDLLLILGILLSPSCDGKQGPPTPAAPADLAGSAADGTAALTWTPSPDASTYSLKRSLFSGGPYTRISMGIEDTSFIDRGLLNSRLVYYVVSASNRAGEGPDSPEVALLPGPATAAPTTPAFRIDAEGDNQVRLSWELSAAATAYDVRRSTTSGGPYTSILKGPLVATTATDRTVTNGTTYFYVVVASNSKGTSLDSFERSATPRAPSFPPATPDGLTALDGDARIALSWNASPEATTYRLKKSITAGGPYHLAAETPRRSFSDQGLPNGTPFFYVVTAVNSLGESAPSEEVAALALASALPPPTPTGLSATSGNGRVSLSWNDAPGAAGYHVQRTALPGGSPITLGRVSSPLFSERGLSDKETYSYAVTSFNSAGTSAPSDAIAVSPLLDFILTPPRLEGLGGNMVVELSWSPNYFATSYNIRRSWASGGPYETIAQVATFYRRAPSYSDVTVTAGPTWYYVVSAVTPYGETGDSNEVGVAAYYLMPPITPPGTPPPPDDSGVTTYHFEDWTPGACGATVAVWSPESSGFLACGAAAWGTILGLLLLRTPRWRGRDSA